jgi:nitroreductase
MAEKNTNLQRLAERIRSRRTTNLFLKTPVALELIRDAIELARWAPNHHLTEPWHFYLLGEQKKTEAVDLTRIVVTELKDASKGDFKAKSAAAVPGWLVVTCQKTADELLQREDYASCCCAIQNLTLYLSEAGVASKWATGPITRDGRFYELLGADPESEFVVGIIWYGYPKILPTQSRKEVSDICSELP